ncbi:MAG: hypothetical protein JNJ94_08530 [Chlorobi bacterium]|jgi:hypothetical protein|nr:hypothetical protein [Chlorobiota bacterium]
MSTKNVLLVEGKNDEHLLYALLEHHAVPKNSFRIKDKQGWEKLRRELDVEIDASDLECLGILVDTDASLNGRWQALCDILQKCGYTSIPSQPNALGTIIEQSGKPRIGVWLMPNNKKSGMLEDFLQMLIPSENVLWAYAQRCVEELPERLFSSTHNSKATTYTYLAWQEQPGQLFSVAVKANSFDANAQPAQELISWIQRLFLLPLL